MLKRKMPLGKQLIFHSISEYSFTVDRNELDMQTLVNKSTLQKLSKPNRLPIEHNQQSFDSCEKTGNVLQRFVKNETNCISLCCVEKIFPKRLFL